MRSELVASLEARVPFDVSKPMFELHDVARGRGWSGTIEKLADKKFLSDEKFDNLLVALKEHELAGEKLCRFYRADDATMKTVRETLKSAKATKGPMQEAYPFLLGEAELKRLQLGEPALLSVDEVDGDVAAVFGAVRAFRVREPVDPKLLRDGAAKIFSKRPRRFAP